ncbi:polysaccharide pyruvyl transferase family protein [Roseococcus sp. SYP-B2431]|uniref:polysaccharide pyruvyl transferase family protein n=1 Tax=Roseococcus sp. SYP-B2431 TaxID=2496640 RepID=UPI0010396FCE|nr:polysaccharide pyruvyl transferase family protein [Roseococcus sp. SYP-B2431]TCH98844.1 polysaccharide pyruvyl transferase family protein [Roseococcus sp. SYP-B2431]
MTIGLVHFNHTTTGGLTGWPAVRTAKWTPNYGDMLVGASVVRQLKVQKGERIHFGGAPRQPVERAIIRGSTYLHDALDFEKANRTLDSIPAPLAIVGLGAQHPTLDPAFLDGHRGARDFIARLNEKSASISVRGAFSAAVVERLGGRNIRITGCPSLFYSLTCPAVRVPEMLRRPERTVGVSILSVLVANMFCHAPREGLEKHRLAIEWAIGNAVNVPIFEQGVLEEYDIADQELSFEERLEAARRMLARIGATGRLLPEDLMARVVSVRNVEEWLARVREVDAMIGFRFHGNMIALLQGKPCYYYTYDSRLKEFADVYGLPQQDVTEPWVDPAAAMISHDWDGTNARIRTLFAELKAFYAENGFDHALEG